MSNQPLLVYVPVTWVPAVRLPTMLWFVPGPERTLEPTDTVRVTVSPGGGAGAGGAGGVGAGGAGGVGADPESRLPETNRLLPMSNQPLLVYLPVTWAPWARPPTMLWLVPGPERTLAPTVTVRVTVSPGGGLGAGGAGGVGADPESRSAKTNRLLPMSNQPLLVYLPVTWAPRARPPTIPWLVPGPERTLAGVSTVRVTVLVCGVAGSGVAGCGVLPIGVAGSGVAGSARSPRGVVGKGVMGSCPTGSA